MPSVLLTETCIVINHLRWFIQRCALLTGRRAGSGTATERWGRVVVFEPGYLNGGCCDVAEEEGAEGEEKYSGDSHAGHAGGWCAEMALFEKLKASGGFANASAAELQKVENMLRSFAPMEKGSG
jgi:hypothetical protein